MKVEFVSVINTLIFNAKLRGGHNVKEASSHTSLFPFFMCPSAGFYFV